jgi:hypothetical protein
MNTMAHALATGIRTLCPGRCRHCGRLMMIVKRQTHNGSGRRAPLGWQCLLCDTFVMLQSVFGRSELRPVPLYSTAYPRALAKDR